MSKYSSLQERLIANSVISTEHFHDGTPCWEWIGRRDKMQYGFITMRKPGFKNPQPVRAHRLSVSVFTNVPMDEIDTVLHLCDRPFCIAPLHLRNGTSKENYDDAMQKGRHYNAQFVSIEIDDYEPSGIGRY
jgi:hypothetical protein